MKNIILYFLLFILAGEVVYLVIPKTKSQEKVLAEVTVATPFVSPEPTAKAETPTPTPTPFVSPKPKAKAEIPQPKFTPEQINGFIERFSGQYGVDPNVMRAIALCESGFNPAAYNHGYAGLYQFGPITWKNLRIKIGEDPSPDLRFNAEEAAQTAAYAISLGERGIWPNCNP